MQLFAELLVEFSEFLGFAVEFFHSGLGWDVVDARVDVIPKHTNEDEWANKSRVDDTPKDNADDACADCRKKSWIGDELRQISRVMRARLYDSSAELREGIWHGLENKPRNAEENTADSDERKKRNAKNTTEIFGKSFAMLEEENSALASGFGSFDVFTIKDPAKAAVAEVGDYGIDNTRDGTAYCGAAIAADGVANSGNSSTNLAKDAFDSVGDGIVGSNGSEAGLDDFLALADDIIWELILCHAFCHHGDLTSFVGVGKEM